MKIGLGTVQFGLDYGVSNKGGKTPVEEVKRIIEAAAQNNVRVIDTAALYGTSEDALGMALPARHGFDIVTKTIKFGNAAIGDEDAAALESAFARSLSRLKASSVYGLMMHDADDLFKDGGGRLFEKMVELKEAGLVKKIGASVYTAGQIDRLLSGFSIDLVQLPVNVLDQRLIRSGHLAKLRSAGVEVHGRSAFLQGLLLMDPDGLPPFFEPVKEDLRRYHAFLEREKISPVHGAIGFVTGIDEIDTVVCGVETKDQLLDILKARPLSEAVFDAFAISDERMLNPAKWTL